MNIEQSGGDSGICRAPDALMAEENANAELLIRLDGSPDDDAIGTLAAFRAKMQMAEEAQKRITAATTRTHEAAAVGGESNKATDAGVDLAGASIYEETAEHAKEILAAAITLRGSTGRDRKESIHHMTGKLERDANHQK